jgi:hypothetical protein
MKIISCPTCGTKNGLERMVCLSCGGDLPSSTEETKNAAHAFVKWVQRTVTKNLNTPKQWSLATLVVVGIYFVFTWFFFGSSHPCGILEARQRPYVVSRYSETASKSLSSALDVWMQEFDNVMYVLKNPNRKSPNISIAALRESEKVEEAAHKFYDEAYRDFIDAPKRAVHDLHENIWNHYSPARCLWEATAWNADPYKGSPSLKDMLKAKS